MKINKTIQYSANVYYNLGLDLQNRGQLNEAISCYQKAVELNPNDFEAYNNLGLAMQCKGEINKAINFYKKALSLNPNLDKTYYNLGIALQEKGQFEEAITYYQKALRLTKEQILEIDTEIHRYIETSMMMGAAESAFSDWMDPEEDIYSEDVQ